MDKFQAIQHLGDDVHVTEDVQASFEFSSQKKKDGNVNELRYRLFCQQQARHDAMISTKTA